MPKSIQKSRIYWLDVARVFAIISISMNHAVNRTFDNYTDTVLEFQTFSLASNALKAYVSVFSRIGVPVFLMISGYLLLNKKMDDTQDVKKFYRHNLLGILITSEIWYLIMFWFRIFFDPTVTMLADQGIGACIGNMILNALFINQITLGSMWYIPTILRIYMLIPIVICALKFLPSKLFFIPVMIVFVAGMVFPNLNSFFELAGMEAYISFGLDAGGLFSLYLLYVFLGYWIGNGKMSNISTWKICTGMLVSFVLCGAYQLWAYSKPGNYLVSYSFAGIIVCASFVFEFIRRKAEVLSVIKRPISYLAKISFGIYFVHIIIMSVLEWYVPYTGWHHSVQLVFLEGISIGGSILIIWLLSKAPFFKKYFFMIKC